MHVYLLVLDVERCALAWGLQEGVGKGQKVFLLSVLNHQKRSFAGPKLYGGYVAHAASAVQHFAAYEITNIRRAGFELRPLRSGNLQLATQKRFGVSNGIDALQLQNQGAFVRPKLFQFDFAVSVILAEGE